MENIKQIIGYEGIYTISESGSVKNNNGKLLKPAKCHSGKGYYQVVLSKNGFTKTYSLHRLVAMCFIPNPDNKPQVNHKDGNKFNNHYTNLEWVTAKENLIHSVNILGNPKPPSKLGKFGSEHNRSKTVYEFDTNGNLLNTYGSALEFKRKTGISNTSVSWSAKNKKQIFGKYYQYTPHFETK
jgi:hypothetical protein